MPKPGELFPSFADPQNWRMSEKDKRYLSSKLWHRLREQILKYCRYKCQYCGFESQVGLQVHHIDGDYKNENSSNLTAICNWCHLVIHSGQGVEIQNVMELYSVSKYPQIEIIQKTRELRKLSQNDESIKAHLGLKNLMPFKMQRDYLSRLYSFPTFKAPSQFNTKFEELATNNSFKNGEELIPKGALKSSFCILPGIRYGSEKTLWEMGIKDWDQFLGRKKFTSSVNFEPLEKTILKAKSDLENGKSDFLNNFNNRDLWRVYETFKDNCLYVDLETTGLSVENDEITLIGVFDGKKTYVFEKSDFKDFENLLKKYPLLVTYNGQLFDVPFLKRKFPNVKINQTNLDLRWPLANLGVRGGLSGAEDQFGIKRKLNFDGFLAVSLWDAYQEGYKGALQVLKQRVTDDVLALKPLAEHVYNHNLKTFPFELEKIKQTKKKSIDFKYDKNWLQVIEPSKINDIKFVKDAFGDNHSRVADAIETIFKPLLKRHWNDLWYETIPNPEEPQINFSATEKLLHEAISIRKRLRSYSKENLILRPMGLLSRLYSIKNRSKELLLTHALIEKKAGEVYRNDPISLAEILEMLAKEKILQKNYEESEKILKKVLKINLKDKYVFGNDQDVYLEEFVCDLAVCLFYQNKHQEV